MPYLLIPVAFAGVLAALWLGWRFLSQRTGLPCPTSLTFLLENPFTSSYHKRVLERLDLAPGLSVLDAGCGPGLLTVPAARAVGPTGKVVALDVQPGMLDRARQSVATAGLGNVAFLLAGLGEGKLPASAFDRALLVTVLGEIPDRPAALREVWASIKPGGFLSITEVLPDPHYQPRAAVEALAAQAGFRVRQRYGNWFLYTLNLERPPNG